MSWLSENPWPLLLLLVGTAVIALISGASKGRSTCGICLLTAAGLYVFESAVVTPSEEVEVQLQIMLVAFREHNQDVINSCIDDKSPKLRETAAEGLNMVTLTKDFHIKDLEVTVEANGQTAKAELRANGTLKVNQWERGSDVVYAERTNRKESLLKRALFYSFYRVLNAIADSPIPADAGNFGLMDRAVVDAVLSLPERERFFPGLRSWAGFRQTGIAVERAARHDDHPRVSLRGLFTLAKTAVFSFSSFPLKFFYVIAGMSAAICMSTFGFVLWHRLFTGLAIPGWASVIIIASFFGSLNALGISILGEYVIRIYDQVRARPVYLTAETLNVGMVPAAPLQSGTHQADVEFRRIQELLSALQQDYASSDKIPI